MEERKQDHISLAFQSRIGQAQQDKRFAYEPMLRAHPSGDLLKTPFLGKSLGAPIWISSMTGGTSLARKINTHLAQAANEFGLGMGLGSCRIVMDNEKYLPDFDLRPIIGDALPLYANLGIAQLETRLARNDLQAVHDLVSTLRADGLIIHVNPMQEWLQPEGDLLRHPPLDTLRHFLAQANYPVIVKEVGQGFGLESMRELLKLKLAAVEFAAFGGTNFAKVELLRNLETSRELYEPLSYIGETAEDMLASLNTLAQGPQDSFQTPEVIISGGLRSFLDGYYFIQKSKYPAIYGMASTFLKYAKEDYSALHEFTKNQIRGLQMAYTFLKVK